MDQLVSDMFVSALQSSIEMGGEKLSSTSQQSTEKITLLRGDPVSFETRGVQTAGSNFGQYYRDNRNITIDGENVNANLYTLNEQLWTEDGKSYTCFTVNPGVSVFIVNDPTTLNFLLIGGGGSGNYGGGGAGGAITGSIKMYENESFTVNIGIETGFNSLEDFSSTTDPSGNYGRGSDAILSGFSCGKLFSFTAHGGAEGYNNDGGEGGLTTVDYQYDTYKEYRGKSGGFASYFGYPGGNPNEYNSTFSYNNVEKVSILGVDYTLPFGGGGGFHSSATIQGDKYNSTIYSNQQTIVQGISGVSWCGGGFGDVFRPVPPVLRNAWLPGGGGGGRGAFTDSIRGKGAQGVCIVWYADDEA